jgi:hypothetical protein
MPFAKGDPNINRAGRPTGSTEKRWNNLQNWYEMMMEGWDDMKGREKFEGAMTGMRMILEKVPSIHLTPEESKLNTEQGFAEKKQELLSAISTAQS